jgi:carbon monoxide dehydrogenase subunit G
VQLEHSFSVPVGIDEAWRILLDVERIGPCMPGAAIDSVTGDDFTGTVKVKLGPINLTYKGKASFVEKDEAAHRAVIDARGKDARGNGTAAAKVTAVLTETGDATTTVQVNTDLDITGKPAQFGRGVMVDVGNKLIGQFADQLAGTLAAGDGGGTPPAQAAVEAAEPETPAKTQAKTPARAPAKKARPKPVRATAAKTDEAPPTEDAAVAPESAAPAESAIPVDEAPADRPMTEETTSRPVPDEPAAASQDPVHQVGSVNGHSVDSASQPQREVEPINLLESAGPAVAKRIAPVAVALVVVLLAARRRRAKHHA